MNKITKIIVGFVGVAMALSLVAVSPAKAAVDFSTMSTADLQALMTALQAKLGAPASTPAPTFTRSLTIGSQGADVTALQNWLIGRGYSIPAGATGYFGAQTKAAVAAYQGAKGITPAAGYFGPLTQASVSANTGVVVNPNNPSTPATGLAGTDGSIDDVNELSQYNNEEAGEGESDVKVLGFELDASNDGDISIKSIKLSFDPAGNAAADSDNLDDYIDEVSIWQGDKKIGSADVSDFNEDNNGVFSKTVSVSNSVVKADKTEKFYVSIDVVGSLDSGDIDSDSWSVDVESVRFEDGSGVVTSDDSTGDINAMDVDFAFVTFSTSADTELKISTDSNTPEAGIVIADDTDNTDNVSLLKGKIKLDGTSDVVLDEFPVTFTVTGTAGNVSSTTGSVILKINGEEYTESVSVALSGTAATVTFDNLDLTIDAGSTISFEVLADINDFDSVFVSGDTLKASVTASNRELIDAENEEGDQLATGEKSGTATGEAQEFRTSGIQLAFVSSSTNTAAGTSTNDDQGTFTIKFKVKAIGDNVYVSSLADAQLSGNTSGKTTILVDRAGTATVGGVSTVIANNTDTDLTSVGNYLIEEGAEETFTITTTVQLPTAGAAGLYRAVLGGVRWSTTDVYPVASSYTSNLDSFKTDYVGLN